MSLADILFRRVSSCKFTLFETSEMIVKQIIHLDIISSYNSPICILLFFHSILKITSLDSIVTTPRGTYSGIRKSVTPNGFNPSVNFVDIYQKIPYAEPPLGPLRFQAPVPIRKEYFGYKVTGIVPPLCPQPRIYIPHRQFVISEDCLYLSIFSPNSQNESDKLFPVMVYIHGGSFIKNGAALYNGEFLAKFGVTVVFINYRLGALGFLTNGEDELPGNYGLLDVIEALRWIKINIKYFQGDNRRITVFGNSAGGVIVGALTVTKKATNLFQRAIIQSGPLITFGLYRMQQTTHKLKKTFILLCKLIGCFNTETYQHCITCLRWIPYQRLVDMTFNVKLATEMNVFTNEIFQIRIDRKLIKDDPINLFRNNETIVRDIFIGVTSNELEEHVKYYLKHSLNNTFPGFNTTIEYGPTVEELHTSIMNITRHPYNMTTTQKTSLKFFYTNWTIHENIISFNSNFEVKPRYREQSRKLNRKMFTRFLNDYYMNAPTLEQVELMSLHNSIRVYAYEFDYEPKSPNYPYKGSIHKQELEYIFGTPFTGPGKNFVSQYNDQSADARIASYITALIWTSFAKHGRPLFKSEYRYQNSNQNIIYIGNSGINIRKNFTNYVQRGIINLWKDILN